MTFRVVASPRVVAPVMTFFANLGKIAVLITWRGITSDCPAVNHSPDKMQPRMGRMGLVAVQTGKDKVRLIGFVRVIRGLESSFPCTSVTRIGGSCAMSIRFWAVAVIPHYGIHNCTSLRVILRILMAIHAKGHIIGEVGTIRSAIICRLKRSCVTVPRAPIIWGLIGTADRGSIGTHPFIGIISPQEILRICALIMRRAPDGSIELAFPINGNGMISLSSMGRVARHARIWIGIKPPVIGIIFNNITDSAKKMP
jgi:hypothetical protein